MSSSEGVGAPRLIIHERARWLHLPDERTVDCARHRLLRRLLAALVAARIDRPGEPLAAAALLAAGWPDEAILPAAARNRIHAALSRLRRLGLEPWLRCDPDGWLLCPSLEIERSPAISPP